jgi:hypothetical protein
METPPPNVALVCVQSTAATKSQKVFRISAETSLSTQNTLKHSDTHPEKVTASGL